MNLAIIHYHLSLGGVTQVIANQLRALHVALAGEGRLKVMIFYGGNRDGWFDADIAHLNGVETSLCEVPALNYDNGRSVGPARLARQLRTFLQQSGFTPADTVIHAHNHSLGKNGSLPGALADLARHGYPLLLQIHDFAEDFRPENYHYLASKLSADEPADLPSVLYPQADHIHYAVLNGRDQAILRRSGLSQSHTHLLPNVVLGSGELPSPTTAKSKLAERFGVSPARCFVLYPTRCIRRKNIGEALLWSVLAGESAVFGFTLAPQNPREKGVYRLWKELASTLELPCIFEMGGRSGLAFEENLAAADIVLTTSVAEGFGMVFLESWLAGRPLVGRDLPEITLEFLECGLQLDHLQAKIKIPVAWVGVDAFRSSLETAYRRTLTSYGRPQPTSKELSRNMNELIQDGCVDFAALGTTLQHRILRIVQEKIGYREYLHELNPWVAKAMTLRPTNMSTTIARNAEVIRTNFSAEACGRRLYALYRTVIASPRNDQLRPPPRGAEILDAFLSIARFSPVRVDT